MFYLATAREIRQKASLYACYYILLASVSFISSIAQFTGLLGVCVFASLSLSLYIYIYILILFNLSLSLS
jgi:hypothetical protein